MTESDLLRGVLDLCRLLGWRTLHIRPGRTAHGWRTTISGDGQGFPDVLAIKGGHPKMPPRGSRGRILAAELKAGRGRLTGAQSEWLGALRDAGVEVHVWTPDDYPDAIATVLT